jgi:hypothetical protein
MSFKPRVVRLRKLIGLDALAVNNQLQEGKSSRASKLVTRHLSLRLWNGFPTLPHKSVNLGFDPLIYF